MNTVNAFVGFSEVLVYLFLQNTRFTLKLPAFIIFAGCFLGREFFGSRKLG